MTSSLRRALGGLATTIAVGLLGVVALPVSTAQADLLNFNDCNGAPLSQAFAPWMDSSWYELAPGGDFESSAWALDGGAQLVTGSESYEATGTLGESSLSLPAGSSAQSPVTCVDAAYPTVRFFTEGTGLIAVSVVDGGLAIPAGVVAPRGEWQPTPVIVTESPVLALLSGGTAQISLRLTGLSGDPQVDDVFIDPWNRG